MLILKLIRLLLGYVSFTAQGGFPERFINLCRYNKITLWELRSRDAVITACVDCSGYKKIRPIARKSGMKVRISRKHGFPFFIARHSRRMGFLIGICLCISVLSVLSTRLWSIDVIGNTKVPSETILAIFEELGVKRGVAGAKINIETTELLAIQKIPELSWLNLNISGSLAIIEVRERDEDPELDSDNTPSDIIAAKDGQIVIIRPFSGTQEQVVGNPVLKGDLLISGIKENADLTVSFCRASGYVVARTSRSVSASQSISLNCRKAVSEKKSYVLNFLSFSIPLGKTAAENAYGEKSELCINGVTLPVGLTEITQTVYEESKLTLTQDRASLMAQIKFFDSSTEQLRYLEVEKANITVDETDGCTVKGEFVCLENIGAERPMQIEENGEAPIKEQSNATA